MPLSGLFSVALMKKQTLKNMEQILRKFGLRKLGFRENLDFEKIWISRKFRIWGKFRF